MNNPEKLLLLDRIDRFELNKMNEIELHSTVESVITLITENDSFEFREQLETIEAKMEEIDFLVEDDLKRIRYLELTKKLKELLK